MIDLMTIRWPVRLRSHLASTTWDHFYQGDYSKQIVPETAHVWVGANDLGVWPLSGLPDPTGLRYPLLVELGRVALSDREALSLAHGKMVKLDKPFPDSLDLLLDERRLAKVEAVDGDGVYLCVVRELEKTLIPMPDPTSPEKPLLLRLVLGSLELNGTDVLALTKDQVLPLDQVLGKALVVELEGQAIALADVLIANDHFALIIRRLFESERQTKVENYQELAQLFVGEADDAAEVDQTAIVRNAITENLSHEVRADELSNNKYSPDFPTQNPPEPLDAFARQQLRWIDLQLGKQQYRLAAAFFASLEPGIVLPLVRALGQAKMADLLVWLCLPDLEPAEAWRQFEDWNRSHPLPNQGIEAASQLLTKAFGPDITVDLVTQACRLMEKRPFRSLSELPAYRLGFLLKNEHPQTLAAIFSFFEPGRAVELLDSYTPETQADIVARMGQLRPINPLYLREVERVLERLALGGLGADGQAAPLDAISVTRDLLAAAPLAKRQLILEILNELHPELALE